MQRDLARARCCNVAAHPHGAIAHPHAGHPLLSAAFLPGMN
jgi:hypothetical protein